jgi:hypothetical protein
LDKNGRVYIEQGRKKQTYIDKYCSLKEEEVYGKRFLSKKNKINLSVLVQSMSQCVFCK